jgi:hypothetical protein
MTQPTHRSWALGVVMVSGLLLRGCETTEPFQEAAPEDIGALCVSRANCTYACLQGLYGSGSYCTRSCTEQACPQGYVCLARTGLGHVCAMGACTEDPECPAAYRCDSTQGVCLHADIPCAGDAECPGATACNQGVCVSMCDNDEDCKQGYRCHGGRGCVECLGAVDCTANASCRDSVCADGCIEELDCRAGFRCAAGACQQIVGGGAGTLGQACLDDGECEGFCLHDTSCSLICDGVADTTTCGAEYHCEPNQLVCVLGPPPA